MDLLLILTYAALCIAIFKIFNIPLNKWTVPTAVLGGVVLVGTLVLLMNYNHPFTQLGNQVFPTTLSSLVYVAALWKCQFKRTNRSKLAIFFSK